MHVVIIPLLKCKSKDPADVNNYMPIAITTALSKVLEQVLLSRLARFGKSTHNSMISNSVAHRSYTNSAIADIAKNSAQISPVTPRDRRAERRRLRIERRRLRIERRRLRIERRRLRIERRRRRIEWSARSPHKPPTFPHWVPLSSHRVNSVSWWGFTIF